MHGNRAGNNRSPMGGPPGPSGNVPYSQFD